MSTRSTHCPHCGQATLQSSMTEQHSAAFADFVLGTGAQRSKWRFDAHTCAHCNLPYALFWPMSSERSEVIALLQAAADSQAKPREGGVT